MRLEGVILLAAPAARSQAYLQTLAASELYPEQVIIMGKEDGSPDPAGLTAGRLWGGIALPDLHESVATTCRRWRIPVVACSATNVNAEEVISVVRDARPKIVIYGGYGGQIVGDEMLGSAPQFLHIHSGWLPDYRGSTTIYYALLHGEDPGVTALVLDRNIDTGPIVARRRYPKPPAGLDIDRIYDPAIRADLLVRVMSDYAKGGSLPPLEHQKAEMGTTYYVIHPVLKHVATLAIEGVAQ
jgi:methionyl-tRNA formyltransferase